LIVYRDWSIQLSFALFVIFFNMNNLSWGTHIHTPHNITCKEIPKRDLFYRGGGGISPCSLVNMSRYFECTRYIQFPGLRCDQARKIIKQIVNEALMLVLLFNPEDRNEVLYRNINSISFQLQETEAFTSTAVRINDLTELKWIPNWICFDNTNQWEY
jgi:hypothetical protein